MGYSGYRGGIGIQEDRYANASRHIEDIAERREKEIDLENIDRKKC